MSYLSGLPVVLAAGILATFNPCGVAMLPSYIVYLIGGEKKRAWDGLWAGLLMTVGFLGIFIVAGFLSSLVASVLGTLVAWLAFLVGVFFIIFGILMIFGKNVLALELRGTNQNLRRGSKISFILYGVLYALGSLGCTLPLFAVLVLSSFHAGDFAKGMWDFILYALGMGVVVTGISIGATLSQQVVMKWVRMGARWMGRLSGLITFATGVYLVMYWFPYIHM
ncbi:cytochrome c biogenesis CcdA family protein [Alicyclobacillus sp. SO9]|uniref:cytochrome c biogenesis CcdA family protein n=1 Tax=Alicyclobacillus sp. SO9 TaxID=2665646 RepID=UPI0018E6F9D7|nr:cytochrome c biogenesis protein CcdA [Alicyclobacillus sp. SO9]QQE79996.1 hypothetical protein GI364_05860 [Alicyclobacillus sp. SO9]